MTITTAKRPVPVSNPSFEQALGALLRLPDPRATTNYAGTGHA
jgi:hypothetical protein